MGSAAPPSTRRKAPSATTAITNATTVAPSRPECPAWMTAHAVAARVTAPRTVPARSSWPRPRSVSRWTVRAATTPATSTIGTLRKNTHRQPRPCTSRPPSSGPAGSATLPTPAQIPIALACSPRSGNERLMIASVPGSSSAAPMPCTARATISTLTDGADPHASEAKPKTASPVSTTGLWPRRSPTVPAASRSAASARA